VQEAAYFGWWLFPDKMAKRAHDQMPGPNIEPRTAVAQYIGLDVSLKDTFISVREDGRRIWRGKCPSDPRALTEVIRKRAPDVSRVVFETGPLSTWYYHQACRHRGCAQAFRHHARMVKFGERFERPTVTSA
jgi:hypothetical protein